VPGEGRVGALMKAVCMDLHGLAENPPIVSCEGGFLQYFREQIDFYDLLRQKPSSLFILSRVTD
jgi:hypothetical protein